jgi:ABC-2 type transport system permease protein
LICGCCIRAPVLSHLVWGRTVATAWGDAAFGYVVYLLLVRPDGVHFAMFVALLVLVAVVFVGFSVLCVSLAFYIGNAVALSDQCRFGVITFSTYPESLFTGLAKSSSVYGNSCGFRKLRAGSAKDIVGVAYGVQPRGALAIAGAGIALFYLGLRRYESGNLLSMHG